MRRIVAVGNLTGVLPLEDFATEEEIKTRLDREFGANWREVLLGKTKPFDYQHFYNVFLRVTDVVFEDQGTVLSLISKPLEVYNIITG
ncbi:hypothetical protein P378_03505 [Desulforamulus profundi]|uniref:Uncharacterized protein n=1 Tax=Desulforamulus profundi TaxID=1383067 RepID=A0A2C6MGW3_9FIRM|nr:hypothetical protein [Desulforamulus profundi]PHJ39488.1 hypothetical protein P378_03505 [Desulforamulus profundi]